MYVSNVMIVQKSVVSEENFVDGFDISGLDTPWDDDDKMTESERRQTACPGHERALPVDDIVQLLDMKEEGLFDSFALIKQRKERKSIYTAPLYSV